MNREKTVLKNTLILTLGTFVPRILGLITTPLITGYVDPAGIGIISFITVTVLTLIVPICTLQLEQSFFRFLIDKEDKKEREEVISSGFFIIFIIMLVVAIVAYFIPVEGFFGNYKWLLILYIWVEIITQVVKFILRAFSMYKQYSMFSILAVVINVISLLVTLILYNMGYMGMFISLLFADVIGLIYVLTRSPILSYIKISGLCFQTAKEMVRYAIPFVPNMISYSINNVADRMILKRYIGNAAIGIYDTANKIPNIVSILYPAFNLAWTESATRSVNDLDTTKYYKKMFDMIFRVLSGGTACLLALSPYLFTILISQKDKYGIAMQYIPTLIIAMYFLCFAQFFSSIYIAKKQSSHMSITTTIAAFINIIINLTLIKLIGLQAAIISTFVSNLILAIYRYQDICKRYYKLAINKRLLGLTIVVFTIQVGFYWSYHPILQFISVLLAIAFLFFNCGDIFKDIFKNFL